MWGEWQCVRRIIFCIALQHKLNCCFNFKLRFSCVCVCVGNFWDRIGEIWNVIYVLVKWLECYRSGVIACSLNSREKVLSNIKRNWDNDWKFIIFSCCCFTLFTRENCIYGVERVAAFRCNLNICNFSC